MRNIDESMIYWLSIQFCSLATDVDDKVFEGWEDNGIWWDTIPLIRRGSAKMINLVFQEV